MPCTIVPYEFHALFLTMYSFDVRRLSIDESVLRLVRRLDGIRERTGSRQLLSAAGWRRRPSPTAGGARHGLDGRPVQPTWRPRREQCQQLRSWGQLRLQLRRQARRGETRRVHATSSVDRRPVRFGCRRPQSRAASRRRGRPVRPLSVLHGSRRLREIARPVHHRPPPRGRTVRPPGQGGKPRKIAITATTGIAACNVGGITINSFAGVGTAEGSIADMCARVMGNEYSKKRWRDHDILVIDEVSMMPGQFLDKLNFVAQRVRNCKSSFGGMQ